MSFWLKISLRVIIIPRPVRCIAIIEMNQETMETSPHVPECQISVVTARKTIYNLSLETVIGESVLNIIKLHTDTNQCIKEDK